MSKIRLIMLSLLAVFALSAVASASASAAECAKEATKKFALCTGTAKTLTEGTKKLHVFTTTGANYILTSATITVECPEILLTTEPTITASGGAVTFAKVVLHFVKCKVAKPSHCGVSEELVKTTSLQGEVTAKEKILFYPESGTEFATITFINSGGTCIVAGKLKVSAENGKTKEGPLCGDKDAETTQAVHVIECVGSTSHLKLGEEKAEFTGNFSAELESKEVFSVIEGK